MPSLPPKYTKSSIPLATFLPVYCSGLQVDCYRHMLYSCCCCACSLWLFSTPTFLPRFQHPSPHYSFGSMIECVWTKTSEGDDILLHYSCSSSGWWQLVDSHTRLHSLQEYRQRSDFLSSVPILPNTHLSGRCWIFMVQRLCVFMLPESRRGSVRERSRNWSPEVSPVKSWNWWPVQI